ncbi:uncharacterized protein ACLA_006310 [Aspergillus clavatus NRRL 1]|uniref:Uncharacterized protein n=1 Tax=Aspergillus clavatus (strain ATCC 1007 / CBS 513.65 / DSM 816 / NCTC 3887 / NRRL 1 / QM 1276 / 107) TaxID=344612 RepID=A1CDE7_ASPCL|nr:uncharacterized protein ACLA_006310 [Aspergillus clavatus NRRL 1]EAW11874.1 hypothetical protein ACLA_006310 [Aspergillus clavatus NRRL 1]
MSRPSTLGSSFLKDRRVRNSTAPCRSFVPACSPIRTAGVRSFAELRSSIRSAVTPVRPAPSAPPAAPARFAPSAPSSRVRPVPAPPLFSTRAGAPLTRSLPRPEQPPRAPSTRSSSPPRRTFLFERTQHFIDRLHRESARRAQDRADHAALDAIRSARDQRRQEYITQMKARHGWLPSAPSSPRPAASSANVTRSSVDRPLSLRERLAQSRARRQSTTSSPSTDATRSSVPQDHPADRPLSLRERLAQSKAHRQQTTSSPSAGATRSPAAYVEARQKILNLIASRRQAAAARSATAARSPLPGSSSPQPRPPTRSTILEVLARLGNTAEPSPRQHPPTPLPASPMTQRTATPAAVPVPAQRALASAHEPLLKPAISINGPRQGSTWRTAVLMKYWWRSYTDPKGSLVRGDDAPPYAGTRSAKASFHSVADAEPDDAEPNRTASSEGLWWRTSAELGWLVGRA